MMLHFPLHTPHVCSTISRRGPAVQLSAGPCLRLPLLLRRRTVLRTARGDRGQLPPWALRGNQGQYPRARLTNPLRGVPGQYPRARLTNPLRGVPRQYPRARLVSPLACAGAETVDDAGGLLSTSRQGGEASAGSCLFISPIWPEPGSSAAGVRTRALIQAFQSWGYEVSYAAGATPNSYTSWLEQNQVQVHHIGPNREQLFADLLADCKPDVVVFDRFMAEEAYSFRVRELAPQALRVLDMQDLHALRRGRQALVEKADKASRGGQGGGGDTSSEVLSLVPDTSNDSLLRELASIHRSDLTLVCSPEEVRLLQHEYSIPPSKMCLASFFCSEASDIDGSSPGIGYDASHGFEHRSGFVTIGGFKHPPNVDGVTWLSSEVWPLIRASLPDAVMRVYGAYPTKAVQQLHKPSQGFLICNQAKTLDVLATHRVLLAPLRYGAGIKGKIVDAWRYGLPVVSTEVGAEGMHGVQDTGVEGGSGARAMGVEGTSSERDVTLISGGALEGGAASERDGKGERWGGRIANDAAAFAAEAVLMHSDPIRWRGAQHRARELLRELYSKERNLNVIRSAVEGSREGLEARRSRDYFSAMLWHQTARSTEFFSRWIELKETAIAAAAAAAAAATAATEAVSVKAAE